MWLGMVTRYGCSGYDLSPIIGWCQFSSHSPQSLPHLLVNTAGGPIHYTQSYRAPFIHIIGSALAFYELLINSFDHQQYGNDLLYFVWADQSSHQCWPVLASAVFVVIIYLPVVIVTKFIPWVPHFYHENYSIHYNSPIWEISFHANRQSGNCSVGYCWLRNTKQSIVRWIAIQWCCDGLACNGLWTTLPYLGICHPTSSFSLPNF